MRSRAGPQRLSLQHAVQFRIGLIVAKFLGPAEYGRFALTLAVR
jgi:hypothetical protein